VDDGLRGRAEVTGDDDGPDAEVVV